MDFDTAARHYAKQKAPKIKKPTIKERLKQYEAWAKEVRRNSLNDDHKTF